MRLILTIVCVALCVLSGCSDEVETTHSVTVDGVVRGYSVHVPSGYDGATALPVHHFFVARRACEYVESFVDIAARDLTP